MAIDHAKEPGSGSARASTRSAAPPRSCMRTTKNFFVRYISSSGLQSGLSVHGQASMLTTNAVFALSIPMPW